MVVVLVCIAFVHELVGSCYQSQFVYMVEFLGDVLGLWDRYIAEYKACSSRALFVSLNVIRIAPYQIASYALLGDLLNSRQCSNVV